MEDKLKQFLKSLKMNEATVSTILGGIVVVVVGVLIFNYFRSMNKGSISQVAPVEVSPNEEVSPQETKDLPITYKVAKGDNLWKISEKYYGSGYNYVDIIKENNLKNPSVLAIGTELTIPNTEVIKVTVTKPAISIEGDKYTVVKGDSLWKVAVRSYSDGYKWVEIYDANKAIIGRNPGLIYSGTELTIPREKQPQVSGGATE